jgi:transcriptional regulator with XRE-family HTH domain
MGISAAQCRAARALLDWSQDQLAENARVARATIADFERNVRMPMRQNLLSMMSTFEAAGVAFIPDGEDSEGGAGVRFRKVELEYSRTLRPDGWDLVLPVRHRGKRYSVVIGRGIIDDIDRASYRTEAERVKAVQNHLPQFLRAAEEKIVRSDVLDDDRVLLTRSDFPTGTF